MRQAGAAPGRPTVEELQDQLAAERTRIALLEAENARLRRRGRQKDPGRLARLGEQIHRMRQDRVAWYNVARSFGRSVRWAQQTYKVWREQNSAALQGCAHAPGRERRTMNAEQRSDPP